VKTLTLYIDTPLWQRLWFILLAIVFVSACVFLIFRQKLRSARREGKPNQLLAEYEMKALHAQMNPHFIFNCLNSIKALVMYDRNKEASSYINRFSKLVRQNLDHSRKQFITLQQNIEYLRDYLEMENFRFTNFTYSFHIDENMQPDEIRIAPMLLQPLVENAIWHGLQLNGPENILHLRFYTKGQTVVCEIEDNGIGLNRAMREKKHGSGNSLGIENIRQRMQVLNEKYNLDYHLTVTDQSDLNQKMKGTLVTVTFKSF
jgi:LytS/YehU family sensor histidine kinase